LEDILARQGEKEGELNLKKMGCAGIGIKRKKEKTSSGRRDEIGGFEREGEGRKTASGLAMRKWGLDQKG